MPLSTRMSRLPSWISRQRMAQEQRLFASAGLILFQMALGTTPNIAPPSSLKFPVSIENSFMIFFPLLFIQGDHQAVKAEREKDDEEKHAVLHAHPLVDQSEAEG